jgi:ankyrin repeat protein/beta-lactamase regulating signal transducer with metallopeptidase domain
METVLTHIADYLWRQSWQIALLIAAVALASWALRNRSAHVRYLLWLLVLAKCLAPPVVQVPVPVLPEQSPVTTALATPAAPLPEEMAEVPVPQRPRPTSSSPARVPLPATPASRAGQTLHLTVPQWLAVAWLAGMTLFLCVALAKAARTILWLRRERRSLPQSAGDSFEQTFRSLRVKRPLCVWLMADIGQPFVWGLFRGDIYLPDSFVQIESSEHRRDVLAHEISHVLRFDAAVNLLQIFAQAIFWFHPLVWWANQKIRREREKCCDEMAIAHLGARPKDYSAAIVNTLIQAQESPRPVPSLAVAGSVKNIEERIRAMLRPGQTFCQRPSLAAAVVVSLFALLTVPTSLLLTARAKTAPPAEQNTSAAGKAANIIWVSDAIDKQGDGRPDDQAWVDMLQARGYALDYSKGSSRLSSSPLKGYWRGLDNDKLAALNAADLIIVSRCTGNSSGYVKDGEREKWNSVKTPMILLNAFYARKSCWRWLNTNGPTPELWPGRPPSHGDVLTLLALERRHPVLKDMGLDANNQIKIFDQTAGSGRVSFNPIANVGNGTLIATPAHQDWPFIAEWKPGLEFFPGAGQTPAGHRVLFAAGTIEGPGCGIGEYNLNEQGEKLFINMIDYMLGNVGPPRARATPPTGHKPERSKSLHQAAADGDLAQVKELLSSGLDVNAKDNVGETPLHRSARAGHKDVVELLLGKGAKVDAGDASSLTPLYYASLHGHEDTVDLLLAKDADVNAQAQYCALALPLLSFAILDGNKDAVRLLISKGANVNAQDNGGTTPLFWAIWEKNKDIVELLISKGADINAKDPQGYTPMYEATYQGSRDLVELLTAKGVAAPESTIHLAAHAGDLARVKTLIEKGADVNARDKRGNTPLFSAVLAKTDEVARFLIANGADVNAQDDLGMTPLLSAAGGGSKKVIELLIAKGADVNARNKFGATPLHAACQRTKDVVELLITKGAEMNGRVTGGPWNGATPLHLVCITGFKDVAELLIAKGMDIDVRDNNGQTPLHAACLIGRYNIAELLIAKGADINARRNDNQTPLHEACSIGRKDVVELLIVKGADVNAGDNKEQTPLSLAKKQGHDEIVRLLRQHGARE